MGQLPVFSALHEVALSMYCHSAQYFLGGWSNDALGPSYKTTYMLQLAVTLWRPGHWDVFTHTPDFREWKRKSTR